MLFLENSPAGKVVMCVTRQCQLDSFYFGLYDIIVLCSGQLCVDVGVMLF